MKIMMMMTRMPSHPLLIIMVAYLTLNLAIGVDDKWKPALTGFVIGRNIVPKYIGDTVEKCMERCELNALCLAIDFVHSEICLLNNANWETHPTKKGWAIHHLYLARSAGVEMGTT